MFQIVCSLNNIRITISYYISSTSSYFRGWAVSLTFLYCNCSIENLIVNPHIEWMKVGGSTINDQNSTEMSTVESETVSTLNVSFNPLLTSHAGQYQCRASVNISDVPVVFNNITTLLYAKCYLFILRYL